MITSSLYRGEAQRMLPSPIMKNFAHESQLTDDVVYLRMAGASSEENFWSPDFFVLLLLERSHGVHSIDFVEYEQCNHQLRISFPGQIHSWKTGPETVGQKLMINKRLVMLSHFIVAFFRVGVNRFPVLNLSREEFATLEKEFAEIGRGLDGSDDFELEVNLRVQLIGIILASLIATRTKQQPSSQKAKPHIVLQFMDLVDHQFKELRSVASYAQQLHVTPNYLSILSKQHLGVSAKKFIHQRVVLESKRLLLGSLLTIKEIALTLGFSDMANFAAYIKEATGLTPKDFRVQIIANSEERKPIIGILRKHRRLLFEVIILGEIFAVSSGVHRI